MNHLIAFFFLIALALINLWIYQRHPSPWKAGIIGLLLGQALTILMIYWISQGKGGP